MHSSKSHTLVIVGGLTHEYLLEHDMILVLQIMTLPQDLICEVTVFPWMPGILILLLTKSPPIKYCKGCSFPQAVKLTAVHYS